MKKTLLISLLFVISLSGSIAQIRELQMPAKNIQLTETTFSFRDVVYEKDEAEPIGLYHNDQSIEPMLVTSEDPAEMIYTYLRKKYRHKLNKVELITRISELKISQLGSVNGLSEYKIEAVMRFYTLKGQMLVILGNADTNIRRQSESENPDYGRMLAEGIDAAILQFSNSNWQRNLVLGAKPEKPEEGEAAGEQQFTAQKPVYTVKPQVKRNLNEWEDNNHLSFSLGYSYRFANIPNDIHPKLQEVIEGLKDGMNFNISYGNYFSGDWGMGFLFSYTFAESLGTDVPFADNNSGQVYYFDVSDKVNVGLIGPALCFRGNTPPGAKFTYHGNFSLGYLFYNELLDIGGEPLDVTGNTIGLQSIFSLGFKLTPNLYLTANVGFLIGSLSSYDVNGQKLQLQENENLSRVDLNLGLNFTF